MQLEFYTNMLLATAVLAVPIPIPQYGNSGLTKCSQYGYSNYYYGGYYGGYGYPGAGGNTECSSKKPSSSPN